MTPTFLPIGTQVNVTCDNGRKFTDGRWLILVTCGHQGEWEPGIPECTGMPKYKICLC